MDKSPVSKICSQTYPNWEQKEKECIQYLSEKGYTKIIPDQFTVDTDIVVPTRSVDAFVALADDLLDPEGSRCSSMGMVIGTAERGKTHTARWYVDNHPDACYVLFIEGLPVPVFFGTSVKPLRMYVLMPLAPVCLSSMKHAVSVDGL